LFLFPYICKMIYEKDIIEFLESFCRVYHIKSYVNFQRYSEYSINSFSFDLIISAFTDGRSKGVLCDITLVKWNKWDHLKSSITFTRSYKGDRHNYQVQHGNVEGKANKNGTVWTGYSGEYNLEEIKDLIYEFMEPYLDKQDIRKRKIKILLQT